MPVSGCEPAGRAPFQAMILKVVILFLAAMALLAMVGKLRLPGRPPAARLRGKCPKCGRHRIGTGPCPCTSAPSRKNRS